MRASLKDRRLLAAVMLSAGIGLIGGGLAAYAVYARIGPGVRIISNQGTSNTGNFSGSALAEAVEPSLVLVASKAIAGSDIASLRATSSQGFVVSASGLIATTTFALQNGNQLEVITPDGVVHQAVVVALDTEHGVALLRAANASTSTLPPVSLAQSDAVAGDAVFEVAVPPPGGTTVVSRYVTVVSESSASPALSQWCSLTGVGDDSLQGAPILNVSGSVSGMAGPTIAGTSSMIPSKFIQDLIRALGSGYSTFGARSEVLSAASASALGLVPGAFIDSVTVGGPAAAAGLQVGDVVRAYDGTTADASHPFDAESLSLGAGQPVTLTVWRAGQELKLSIVVGSSSS